MPVAPGWGYRDVLPWFMKLEDCALGDSALRGRGGPIAVTELGGDPISDAFVDACVEAGYPRVADYNGDNPDGTAPLQVTARNGRRCSAAVGYLRPALDRKTCRSLPARWPPRSRSIAGARAAWISRSEPSKRQATAAPRDPARRRRDPLAATAGAFGYRQRRVPARHGITVVSDLPGVGENLQDHLMPRITFETNQPITVNDMLGSPLALAKSALRYLLFRDGLFATTSLTALA
jgi:choline dehydrogenase